MEFEVRSERVLHLSGLRAGSTALKTVLLAYRALTGGASLWRASGACSGRGYFLTARGSGEGADLRAWGPALRGSGQIVPDPYEERRGADGVEDQKERRPLN